MHVRVYVRVRVRVRMRAHNALLRVHVERPLCVRRGLRPTLGASDLG